ncbi:MAG: class I SAM-dependent methyltransferase family protein [Candidatus Methanomethylophilaceae archaeon]|nr:class I SAM-dependent methyltransferase family protein [Candidatus Methanomethylophilaceae archaeon]
MKRVTFARLPSYRAGPIIRDLMGREYVDLHAKIGKDEKFRYVPILPEYIDTVGSMGIEMIEGDAHTLDRRSPQEKIHDILTEYPELDGIIPEKWEYVGDIVIVKMDPRCRQYKDLIGRTYAEVLGAKTVCADVMGVSGEFRQPSMEIIYGTDTESVRLENGIRYGFDVTKVMFASGNTDERMRMRKLDCTGETVVDMFAGIGYFTLPLAKYSCARRVFACEKNPESYQFLCRNIRDNELTGKVIPILSDNRNLLGKHFADRILMGYVQTTSEFVPKALSMIRPGGIIHYHDTFYVNEYEDRIRSIFDSNCGEDGYEILRIHEVKSYAPSVSHYVADIRIRPSRQNPMQ